MTELKHKRPERWKPVTRNPRYEVSTWGNVWDSETAREVGFIHNHSKTKYFGYYINSKRHLVPVRKVMWETFIGKIPDGYYVQTKDGVTNPFELEDLVLVSKRVLAQQRGHGHRKGILQIGENGEILNIFPTAKEAGNKIGYHVSTVIGRCRGYKHFSHACAGGYDFAYEDSKVSINRALIRLGVDPKTWKY